MRNMHLVTELATGIDYSVFLKENPKLSKQRIVFSGVTGRIQFDFQTDCTWGLGGSQKGYCPPGYKGREFDH